jgi:hypothetical protein
VVAGLQELAGRLHQLRDDNRPAIDWTPLEKLDSQADAAAQAGDFCTAVKRYAEALRETMRQIREQGRTVDDHPTVDYRK